MLVVLEALPSPVWPGASRSSVVSGHLCSVQLTLSSQLPRLLGLDRIQLLDDTLGIQNGKPLFWNETASLKKNNVGSLYVLPSFFSDVNFFRQI